MGRHKGQHGKPVFFGLEYDHDEVPNAVVVPSTRAGKIVKWVKEYTPTEITRADGKRVRRERTGVVCPVGFRLRKDEIIGAMKEHKTESWQDGKFFVVMIHRQGEFEHPDTVAMKKAKLKKEMDDVKRELEAKKLELDGQLPLFSDGGEGDDEHKGVPGSDTDPVAGHQGPSGGKPGVITTTATGLTITDNRRATVDQAGQS